MRSRPFADAGRADELRQLLVDAEPRILQVHRVDRVRRDRHLDARRADEPFLAEADRARVSRRRGRPSFDAVEIDEEHRLAGPVRDA